MSEAEEKSAIPADSNEGVEQPNTETLMIATPKDAANTVRELTAEVREQILSTILIRLKKPTHFKRPNVDINEVQRVLLENPTTLDSLYCMEHSDGQPDIVSLAKHCFVFADCSPESPQKRGGMDFCAITGAAEKAGVELLSKEIYTKMQKIGIFDEDTSSVLYTPNEMVQLGLMLVGFRGNKGASFMNAGIENKRDDRGWRGMISVSRKKKEK